MKSLECKIDMKLVNTLKFTCQFAIDDFKNKYAGSVLGFLWAFVQPILTIGVYWFVFQRVFGSKPVNDMPYILWLFSGLLPWFFISDAIMGATSSLIDYGYLVKKVVFNIYILPIARVIAVLFIHIILFLILLGMFLFYGLLPTKYILQLPIYLFFTILLCSGIAYFTAALYVFFKDIIQIISVILQLLFWGTPIVWQLSTIDGNLAGIFKFNPFFYIVNGYRDAMVIHTWFWEYDLKFTIYYWGIALFIFILGTYVFRKLRPHFADVM